jgi:hypothetical protein
MNWLTEQEVCRRLTVGRRWVRENRQQLGGRVLKWKRGKSWRYSEAAVMRALINPWEMAR